MDPDNALRILRGEQFVDLIPERYPQGNGRPSASRGVVKSEDGCGSFEVIEQHRATSSSWPAAAVPFDLTEEYGVPAKLIEALDITTQLAIAAGLDALREAGIPLVQTSSHHHQGHLPARPLAVARSACATRPGVIFGQRLPGRRPLRRRAQALLRLENLRQQIVMLEELRQYVQ